MTKNEIASILQQNNVYAESIKASSDNKIIFRIPIPFLSLPTYRYKTVQSEAELIEFINLFNYPDNIVPDNFEDVEPSISFFKGDKKVTIYDFNAEKAQKENQIRENFFHKAQKSAKLNSALKNLPNPNILKQKISSLTEHNEKLKQSIASLKNTIIKKSFIFSHQSIELPAFSQISTKTVSEEQLDPHLDVEYYKNFENNIINNNKSLQASFFNGLKEILILDDKYNKLLIEKEMLQKQFSYLKQLLDLPILKKVFLSNTTINQKLNQIESSYNVEDHFESNFEQLSIDIRELYFSLSISDQIDFLNDFFISPGTKQKEALIKKYKHRQIDNNSKSNQSAKQVKINESPTMKNQRILKDLIRQFEKNLTFEQKQAMKIYNSELYLLINEITKIPNYENLSDEEINNIIISGPSASKINFLYILKQEQLSNKSNDNNEVAQLLKNVLGNSLIEAIHNLRKQIEILSSIPPTSIILPEDITVYRGIGNSSSTIGQEISKPNSGRFMSTSMDSEIATNLARKNEDHGDNTRIIKINLKKGSPVMVSPISIIRLQTTNAFCELEDATDTKPTMEVLIDMEHFKSPELKRTTVYDYYVQDDDTLAKRILPIYLYECDMETKEEVQTKIDSFISSNKEYSDI